MSQRLTINFGIRWDTDLPHTERYNRLSYFDPDAPSPLAGKVPGFTNLKGAMKFTSPDHRRQTPTDLNNWGPRFGFAYKINQKTVFRGAYGVLYGVSVMQAAGVSADSVSRFLGLLQSAGVPLTLGGIGDNRTSRQGLVFGSLDFAPPSSSTGKAFNVTFNGNWNEVSPASGLATELPSHSGDRTNWRAGRIDERRRRWRLVRPTSPVS